jgi:hypothetical protein
MGGGYSLGTWEHDEHGTYGVVKMETRCKWGMMRNSLRLKEAVERKSYDISLASRCNTNRLIVLVYSPPFS